MTPDARALAAAIETTSCCERHVAEREALPLLDALADAGWVLQEIQPTASEAGARRSDPETSRAAAESIDNLTERQAAVLATAAWIIVPFTYDRLCALYDYQTAEGLRPRQTAASIRSRAKELRDAGYIAKAHGKGVSDAGRPAQLWRVARKFPVAA